MVQFKPCSLHSLNPVPLLPHHHHYHILSITSFVLLLLQPCFGPPLNPENLMRKAISKLNISDVVFDAHNYVRSLKDGSVEAESRLDVTNSMLGLMGVPSWQRGSSNNIMGSSLSSLISVMQLGKVAYEFEHSLFAAASCTFCKASFMFMQYYLDRGLSLEEMKEDAKMICHGVSLVSKTVCRGLVDVFAFDVVHVLRCRDLVLN